MNDPHKLSTEFGSDNAPEHSAAIVSHHDSIKWFEAIPGEQLSIRVHGTQVNGRYAIMENIAAPGTATPMHFHAEDEIFHILEGTVTFSIDSEVFNASVGSIVVIPSGAHHAWRNRSNSPIRMLTFFSPGGVEELYPKLVGLSLEELALLGRPSMSNVSAADVYLDGLRTHTSLFQGPRRHQDRDHRLEPPRRDRTNRKAAACGSNPVISMSTPKTEHRSLARLKYRIAFRRLSGHPCQPDCFGDAPASH